MIPARVYAASFKNMKTSFKVIETIQPPTTTWAS